MILAQAGALATIACALAAERTVVRIEAIGTAFRVTLSDGSIKQGSELAGAVLVFDIAGQRLRIRIAAITPDPIDKTGNIRNAETDAPLCSPDPDGKQLGFPLAGRSAADGRFIEAEPTTFELICTSGAQGKCVRFGYRPWEKAPDGRPMRAHYNACVRMLRADYCGDGRSWTRDGTLIDMSDDLGIQKSDTLKDPSFSFEAGWSPEGAVCTARTRIPENLTLERLKTYCPRLAVMPSCDEATARAAGALLFNRSR
jgi:ADYC domain-containing protein